MLVDLKAKYLNLPASPHWPSIVGTRFTNQGSNYSPPGSILCRPGDIDSDGRDEVFAFTPDPTGLTPGSLGVLSYFDYAAMAPQGYAVQQNIQLVTQTLLTAGLNVAAPNWPSCSIWPSCIRESKQIDLVIFDQSTLSLSLWRWMANDEQTGQAAGLVQYWSTTGGTVDGLPITSPPPPSWPLSSSDQFSIGDIDGDGTDEILVYDNNSNLALLKWNGSGIGVIWNAGGKVQGVGGLAALVLTSGASFQVGDIDGDGQAEIVAFDANATLSVLRWNGSIPAIELCWQNTGGEIGSASPNGPGWTLASSDSFYIADIDGDGQDEIIAYVGYLSSGVLGAIRWSGSDLVVLGKNTGRVEGVSDEAPGWLLTSGQVFYVSDLERRGQAVIVALNNNDPGALNAPLGVLRWLVSDNTFVTDATADYGNSFQLTNSATGLTWIVSSDDVFTCADVDGDGLAEVIVKCDRTAYIGLLKWSASQGQLVPLWMYTTQNAGPLLGWGLGLIAEEPATAFQPFTGDRGNIYKQITQTVTSASSLSGIRGGYANLNNKTLLSNWKSQIDAALSGLEQTPPIYAWQKWPLPMDGFKIEDLSAVLTTLQVELNSAILAYTFSDNLADLLSKVTSQQDADLSTAVDNLVVPVSPESAVDYWIGQVVNAALWGIAAAPLGPAAQVIGAAAASLFGSALGALNSSNPPGQIQYAELQGMVDRGELAAGRAIDQQTNGLVTDPVKLSIIGPLLEGSWQWDYNTSDEIAAASSSYNRLYFYQLLMPRIFTVWQWTNSPYKNPWYLAGSEKVPFQFYPPSYAVWRFNSTSEGLYNIYVLAQQNSPIAKLAYPSNALMTDLISTLGISPSALLNGTNGWGIPITLYTDQTN